VTAAARLRLTGGRVVTPGSGEQLLDVVIDAGRIVALEPPGERTADASEVIDVSGHLVAPGFIDLQINGGWGHDFTSDPTTLCEVAAQLPSTGVTSFLPTIVTSSPEARQAALAAFVAADIGPPAATPIGLHLEGPAISVERLGAHDARWVGAPEPSEVAGWTPTAGVVLVTLAPEAPGSAEMIDALVANGVVVAAGHSQCTAEQFESARRAGVTMVTHLFNAMAPFSHRHPGMVGAALAGDVFAGLICDGVHVDPVAVRVAWRALGPRRTVLVTDAMAALGIDTSDARLGELAVTIDESGVRTPDGVLAGSNLALDQALRNLVAFTGCSAAEAIGAATANPAAVLGLTDRGTVAAGARADLVVLDPELRVQMTIIGGRIAWKS
jgi:N-acetylglucosamine-6-phosphate deacetylase